jgi:DNA-binding transcriptional MerR regulator/uncharacterized protein (DUF433 family)
VFKSHSMSETTLLGTGIYPLGQAARLVGAEPRSVRRWLLGYSWSHKGQRRRSEPLWKSELAEAGLAEPSISFHDLLELRLVHAFTKHGVSLKVIRTTVDAAREQFDVDYPLTSRKFRTDGRKIFVEAYEKSGQEHLLDVVGRQFVFKAVIQPSLYAGIEYDGKIARRWFPLTGAGATQKDVVLDPSRQFGSPIVVGPSIPTDTLYASFLAERDVRRVGRIFDVPPRMVTAAVRFEESLKH